MKVIGLTGGIGMGKTTVADIFKKWGFPVHNADAVVKREYAPGGAAFKFVAAHWPGMIVNGRLDGEAWSNFVFQNPDVLDRLEKLLHPIVAQAEEDFLQKARKSKTPAAVLEIPLLFETGGDARCDIALCVEAPPAVQKARVLTRPNMDERKFNAIMARQMPCAEKRKRAHHTIPTDTSVAETERHLHDLLFGLGLLKNKARLAPRL